MRSPGGLAHRSGMRTTRATIKSNEVFEVNVTENCRLTEENGPSLTGFLPRGGDLPSKSGRRDGLNAPLHAKRQKVGGRVMSLGTGASSRAVSAPLRCTAER